VETYCSLDANDYTDGAALQALNLLSKGLPRVKADPSDLEARLQCLMGAWISMTGIVTGTRLGASHAIGHILGGTANVPHGYTSCVMLPYVLDYNAAINSNRQADIARALGQPNASAGDALDKLISGLGMPRTLRDVDITEDQLPLLAENCMLDSWTYSNPREIRAPEQVMEILRAAF
jgi:maleylacetate reductase